VISNEPRDSIESGTRHEEYSKSVQRCVQLRAAPRSFPSR
jgi:hypothetical protein